jgi:Family of unknown function (DUF6527)
LPTKEVSRWASWLWTSLCHALGHRRRIRAYKAVKVVATAPKLEEVEPSELVLVRANGKDRWVLLRCPCGCNDVVTLSVQQVHQPHWKLSGVEKRPTLHPSIWRTEGCRSHFLVREGKVIWA